MLSSMFNISKVCNSFLQFFSIVQKMTDYECYRDLIYNAHTPIVFRGSLDWNLLSWNLEKWCNIFKEEVFPFRCGKRSCQRQPLWESQCTVEYHTMNEFFQFAKDQVATRNKFWYFDYKHIADFFVHNIKLFEISYSKIGFPDRTAQDSTIWIGSPGAHTPCHVDSYGFNLVAQVYGSKRWLLFPPSETENLGPTRVPYEESSIYSRVNFSCYENCKDIKIGKCFLVDLNPGDVLYVPAKWWHYVENLTTSVSINTWIPHKNDNQWRLEEALVRYFIASLSYNLTMEEKKIFLNPNELDIDSALALKILNFCQNNCAISADESVPKTYTDYRSQSHAHRKYTFVPCISYDDAKRKIQQMSVCNQLENNEPENDSGTDYERNVTQLQSVINAFCHPSIITQVKNKLLSENKE